VSTQPSFTQTRRKNAMQHAGNPSRRPIVLSSPARWPASTRRHRQARQPRPVLERLARSGRDRRARIPGDVPDMPRASCSSLRGPLPCSRNQAIRGHRGGRIDGCRRRWSAIRSRPGVADSLDSWLPRGAGLVADPADACEVGKTATACRA
jgi:hypothetical protein